MLSVHDEIFLKSKIVFSKSNCAHLCTILSHVNYLVVFWAVPREESSKLVQWFVLNCLKQQQETDSKDHSISCGQKSWKNLMGYWTMKRSTI